MIEVQQQTTDIQPKGPKRQTMSQALGLSDVQGLGKPPGFKGKGQEGKGQGKDFMTLRKPLPL